MLEVLSESTSFVDLIRRLRVINHFSESDAESMNQLSQLVTEQQNLLASAKGSKRRIGNK